MGFRVFLLERKFLLSTLFTPDWIGCTAGHIAYVCHSDGYSSGPFIHSFGLECLTRGVSVVIFRHSALSPWLVFILAPSAKSRLASWALQSLVLLGAGSPGTGLWFLPLARHIAAYRCSGTSDSWGRSKRLMVFGPLFRVLVCQTR